ncbi:hypothetical protein OAV62_01290 [bacterium]|nr:hypothetical protein [bacterium]
MSEYDENYDYGDGPERIRFEDGFKDRERTSGFNDEGWKDLRTHNDLDFPNMYVTPEEKFHQEVQIILMFKEIDQLTINDKQIIVNSESRIKWIKLKTPLYYVLGYLVAKKLFDPASIDYTLGFTDEATPENKFNIIKYARYWKAIMGI